MNNSGIKKSFGKRIALILAIFVMMGNFATLIANAVDALDSIKVTQETRPSLRYVEYGSGNNIQIPYLYTEDTNVPVYCLQSNRSAPGVSGTIEDYTRDLSENNLNAKEKKDIAAIIAADTKYDGDSDKVYYVKSMAIFYYFCIDKDGNLIPESDIPADVKKPELIPSIEYNRATGGSGASADSKEVFEEAVRLVTDAKSGNITAVNSFGLDSLNADTIFTETEDGDFITQNSISIKITGKVIGEVKFEVIDKGIEGIQILNQNKEVIDISNPSLEDFYVFVPRTSFQDYINKAGITIKISADFKNSELNVYTTAMGMQNTAVVFPDSVHIDKSFSLGFKYTLPATVIKNSEDGIIAGVSFKVEKIITDTYGNETVSPFVDKVTTDEDGQLFVQNLTIGDKYRFTEVDVPSHYETLASQEITIDGSSANVITFENTLRKNSIQIMKVDSDTQNPTPLPGAKFKITHTTLIDPSTGTFYEYIETTGSDGMIAIADAPFGIYNVQEIESPKGYVLDGQIRTIEVGAEGGQLTVTNKIEARLKIIKKDVDADGNVTEIKMDGVEFQIFDKNGSKVTCKDASGNDTDTFVTDENSEVTTLCPLIEGDYTLIETKARPGYDIMDPVPFTVGPNQIYEIDATGFIKPIGVINVRSTREVELIKVDKNDTKKTLSGVTFDLYKVGDYYEGGTDTVKIGTYVTEGGKISVDGLQYGSYYFVETKTADGYILNNEKIEFTINDDTPQKLTLTAENVKKGVNPKTGDIILPIVFVALVSFGAFASFYLKKRRAK